MRDKVRAFATQHFDEYCALVLSRMRANPPDDKALASFQWMLEWGWGRAPQAFDVKVGNLSDGPVEFRPTSGRNDFDGRKFDDLRSQVSQASQEIIGRLTKEGLLHLNKAVPIPVVPQRIAVISSAIAAGYGDFIHHIDNNPFGYKIFHELYHAAMQGQDAEASVISALRALRRQKGLYDAVVIVRGGGSQTDLSCFDAYGLAAEVAKFPLPVLTGIGHERDDTVVDIVAHMSLKTPTAVAEFLLSLINSFEERILNAEKRLIHMIRECLMQEDHRFQYLVQHFRHIAGAGFGRDFVPRAPNMVRNEYPAGFPVRLHEKDLRICRDMSARHGVQLPVVEMTLLHYRRLIEQGHGDDDISTIFRLKDALFAAAGPRAPGTPAR